MPTIQREIYTNGVLVRTEPMDIPQEALNRDTLVQRAQAALAANATYLALASPSVAQNTAQLKTVTKECNALIRLALSLLDDVSGT